MRHLWSTTITITPPNSTIPLVPLLPYRRWYAPPLAVPSCLEAPISLIPTSPEFQTLTHTVCLYVEPFGLRPSAFAVKFHRQYSYTLCMYQNPLPSIELIHILHATFWRI